MGVILDVVYNHQGPEEAISPSFQKIISRIGIKRTGSCVQLRRRKFRPRAEFIVGNARYWIDEFHLDGLRLDATQNIFDTSTVHILSAITRAVRESAPGRSAVVVAENEPQMTKLVLPPEEGGYGLDALWNDDFHHTARVAMTGKTEAYYTDYLGTPQEFISSVKWGYLYQGQYYRWQKKKRGIVMWLEPAAFVVFCRTTTRSRIHQVHKSIN
jgi:maltooligosyltrehalose trehalohydrolase